MSRHRGLGQRGMSLVEVMIAVSILTVGIMAFISTFQYITKAIHVSRARTLATNLVQEKIENLRNVPYAKLMITTKTVTWSALSPAIEVDAVNYPPETVKIGGIEFMRGVFVSFAQMDGDSFGSTAINYPDTGMKDLKVHVAWRENGVWKHTISENLYENPTVNPLTASRTGKVYEGALGGPVVPGARVRVIEHPDWNDFAGTDGAYTLKAQAGTYTLMASSPGYTCAPIASVSMSSFGVPGTTNFVMTKLSTGSVAGNVWMNTGLVIAQVIKTTTTVATGWPTMGGWTGGYNVEAVELFNPTTHTIDVNHLRLTYQDNNGTSTELFAGGWWLHESVGAGKSFLYSNAPRFMALGQWVTSDFFLSFASSRMQGGFGNGSGCLTLYDTDGVTILDRVGWDDKTHAAPCKEGNAIPSLNDALCPDGIGTGNQIVRVSSPGLASDAYGKAYDSDDNARDFIYPRVVCPAVSIPGAGFYYSLIPHGSGDGSKPVLTGKPALGALVATNDSIGASTVAYTAYVSSNALQLPYAAFTLSNAAAGTWTVIAASGSYQWRTENVTVAAGQTTAVPNTRSGLPDQGQVQLDTYTFTGYVSGKISDQAGAPLCPSVNADGGTCACTGGMYFCYDVSTGPVIAVFNPNPGDGLHVELNSDQDIQSGQVNSLDVTLPTGGTISGFVGTDATTGLGNITVSASKGGLVYGTAVSDSTGHYYIRNLAADTYTVAPVLDPLMTSTPANRAGTSAAGTTVSVDSFTVSGAGGKVAGHIYYPAGTPVTTGAIVLVSTATINQTPPSIFAVSAGAQAVYYAASSLADGSYEVEVRGSPTAAIFNLSVFYPNVSATSVCVSTQAYTGLTIEPSKTTTKDVVFTSVCQ